MRITDDIMYTLSSDLKRCVEEYIETQIPKSLIEFLQPYNFQEKNILLSAFDRYGFYLGYQKSGIRYRDSNGEPTIVSVKFGYTNSIRIPIRFDRIATRACEQNLGKRNVSNHIESCTITMPKTLELMISFKIIYAMRTFPKTSYSEAKIFAWSKWLKVNMQHIKEEGIDNPRMEYICRCFKALSERSCNQILKVFDCKEPVHDGFMGIRLDKRNRILYPVDAHGKQCKFAYNSITIPATTEVVKAWKDAI